MRKLTFLLVVSLLVGGCRKEDLRAPLSPRQLADALFGEPGYAGGPYAGLPTEPVSIWASGPRYPVGSPDHALKYGGETYQETAMRLVEEAVGSVGKLKLSVDMALKTLGYRIDELASKVSAFDSRLTKIEAKLEAREEAESTFRRLRDAMVPPGQVGTSEDFTIPQ